MESSTGQRRPIKVLQSDNDLTVPSHWASVRAANAHIPVWFWPDFVGSLSASYPRLVRHCLCVRDNAHFLRGRRELFL